jgi:hypothetical protein
VHFEVQPTAEDYVDAQRLQMRPSKSLRIVLYFLLPPAGVGSAYLLYESLRGAPLIKHDYTLPTFLVLFPVFFGLLRNVYAPWYTRRLFKQQKTTHNKISFVFDTAGMRAESLHGSSNIPWSHFRKWKANDRVLLLFQSDALMNLVPLRALPDPASREALLALVQNGIGPQA